MTRRIQLLLVLALGVVAGFGLSNLFARDEAPSAWQAIEKTYAEANLELAQARLAVAQSQNKAVAGTIDKETMDVLTSAVQIARDQVKQIAVNQNANSLSPQIAAMEGLIRGLEVNYGESLKANKLQDGTVPDLELHREQAEIAVAKARLTALRVLLQQPPQVRVEWQIRMLQDDIRALWARPLIQD
jgi:predicted RNA-binding protein Jag